MIETKVNQMEKEMEINCSFEKYRKSMIRAGRDNRHIIETAGRSLFVLERTHNDNMINRWISTPIAVSEDKGNLIELCRKLYGPNVKFDDSNRTMSVETDMGEAYFSIESIAAV